MNRVLRYLFIALTLLGNFGCAFAQCTVNWSDPHQTIDGFGASSAWTGARLSDVQADLFFSTRQGISYTSSDGAASYTFNGIGLSLLRNRIRPDDDTYSGSGNDFQMVTDDLVTMQKAQARGARIWSTPWTPPKALKDNNSFNGGHFVGTPANYQTYANELADYVANMKDNGINLYAISIQNEPDWDPTTGNPPHFYDSCLWSVNQFHDFVPYLHSALAANHVSATKIMLPESANWPDPHGLANATLNDPATAANVSIFASHNYVADNKNGDQTAPAAVDKHGKQLWETEVSTSDTFDGGIANAIYWATRIHLFPTTPGVEVNAWHYWWLLPGSSSNGALTDTKGVPAKRLFALGNFSRFIRPGYVRFGVTGETGGTLISAFRGPDGNFAIVAINPTSSPINEVFNVSSFAGRKPNKFIPWVLDRVTFVPNLVTPWITSGNDISGNSLSPGSSISFNNASFNYSLPPLSVVTFAGQSGIVWNLPWWWRWIINWWWLLLLAILVIVRFYVIPQRWSPPPPPLGTNPVKQP